MARKKVSLLRVVVFACVLLCLPGMSWSDIDLTPYFDFYFEDGNTWTYLEDGSSYVTESVLSGSVSINNVPTKVLLYSGGEFSGSKEYYSKDATDYYFHRVFIPNLFVEGEGFFDVTATLSPPARYPKSAGSLGDLVSAIGSVNFNISGLGTFTLSYSWSWQVVGYENVTVPYGNYNTLKFQTSLSMYGSVNETYISTVSTGTSWYAAYLGLVKSVEYEDGEESTSELTYTNVEYTPRPIISVNPTSLSNSVPPYLEIATNKSFEVWNSGQGTLNYSISSDENWLHCTPASETSTGERDSITAVFDAAYLTPGFYTATIAITDPEADNSPMEIPVSLTVSEKSPIYRFWSARNRAHFYTMSEAEKYDITVNYPEDVWKYERVAWFAYSAGEAPAGAKPVYRFWSSRNKVHFYTISESEKDNVIATYPEEVWRYERIAYYAYAPGEQQEGAKPVYRFWSPKNRRHFYTISENEKNNIIATYPEDVWRYERIAWYAFDVP